MFRLLDEEGWRYSTDSGWNDWDIQIYGNFWWSIALQTVTEYHGAGKCLTRVRLRNRMVITMIIFNLVAISLLIYHQVNVSRVDFWPIVFYLAFLGFLGTRARALKSRVAELVDLAAFRAGLQRVSRKGKPVAPTAGAGTGGCGERDRSRVAAVARVISRSDGSRPSISTAAQAIAPWIRTSNALCPCRARSGQFASLLKSTLRLCISLRDNRHHSNAHVEDLIHLLSIDLSIFLQDLEDARDAPAFRFNYRVAIRRQNSRQIVDETATGDMSEPFDHASGNFRQQRLIIFVHAQQFVADRDCRPG